MTEGRYRQRSDSEMMPNHSLSNGAIRAGNALQNRPGTRPVIRSKTPDTVPAMSEADLQRLLTDAASALGWDWVHAYPLRTAQGWATPLSGPLGEGWPDLFLAHPKQGRLLAIEVKAANGHVTADQLAVHAVLVAAGLEVHIVRPADIDTILAVLSTPTGGTQS